MADDTKQLVADARKFSAQFGGLIKAAELLGKVESIEQATNEAERRLAAAQDEEKRFAAERVADRGRFEDEKRAHEKHIRDIEADAVVRVGKRMADAQIASDEIIAQAHVKARDFIDAGKSEAAKHADAVIEAQKIISNQNVEIADKQQKIKELNSQLAEAQARIDEIDRKRAELRARL